MSGIAIFDYFAWQFRYPVLAMKVPQGMAAMLFDEACLYLDNTACSRARDPAQRLTILGMIVAHLAELREKDAVGRLASATEGSVSVSMEYAPPSGSSAWWNQTQPGASAYQALSAYRTFRYFTPGMRRW